MISSDSITEIDGSEHGMVVERNSRLELTCRVTSGDRTPAFIIWQKENKVRHYTYTLLTTHYTLHVHTTHYTLFLLMRTIDESWKF